MSGAGVVHYQLLHRPRSVPTALGPAPLATGTNFIGAERELKEAIQDINQSKIGEVLVQKGIKWIVNTPIASHQGGIWERQICTVRKVLNSVLNQQVLDEEGLYTILCEVEAIMNDRPITKASDDPNDLEPLSPNHLLLMKKTTNHATRSVCERGLLFT